MALFEFWLGLLAGKVATPAPVHELVRLYWLVQPDNSLFVGQLPY